MAGLTTKQKADLVTLKTVVNNIIHGHATQRLTTGAATDVTGTTGLGKFHASDQTAITQFDRDVQEGYGRVLRQIQKQLDNLPKDGNWV